MAALLHLRCGRSIGRKAQMTSAYCLLVTLKNLARPRASGLTRRSILKAFATIQIVDVHLPTTDGRHLVLPRHTRPSAHHAKPRTKTIMAWFLTATDSRRPGAAEGTGASGQGCRRT